MGHLAMDTYWEQALHQNSSVMFNLALSRMENVVVTSVPYQIHRNGTTGHHFLGSQDPDKTAKPQKD